MVSIAVSFYGKSGGSSQYGRKRVATQWAERVSRQELWQRGVNQPALLAKSKPEDDVTVILPSVGVQVTDEDNLQDEIDTINDKINHYKDVVDSLTPLKLSPIH